MIVIAIRLIVALFFLISWRCATPALADENLNVMAPEEVFIYAEELRGAGDYVRAATEYGRYVSFALRQKDAAGFPRLETARFEQAVCLDAAGESDRALRVFAEFGAAFPASERLAEGLLRVGAIYEKLGDTAEALIRYQRLLALYPERPEAGRARLRAFRIMVVQGRDAEARGLLAAGRTGGGREEAEQLENALASWQVERKSPLAAGILSALLPGAGHAYLGRPRDALFAFLSNGLLLAAAAESFHEGADFLGGILSVIEFGWYSGTVYGAVSLAHRYNREQQEEIFDAISPYVSGHRPESSGGIFFTMKF